MHRYFRRIPLVTDHNLVVSYNTTSGLRAPRCVGRKARVDNHAVSTDVNINKKNDEYAG